MILDLGAAASTPLAQLVGWVARRGVLVKVVQCCPGHVLCVHSSESPATPHSIRQQQSLKASQISILSKWRPTYYIHGTGPRCRCLYAMSQLVVRGPDK